MRFRWGALESSSIIFILGFMVLIFYFMLECTILGMVFITFACIFFVFGFMFLGYMLTKNKCRPFLDKIESDEIIWHRYTRDGVYNPQIVPKGAYGITKGLMYRTKADIINKGDFPVRCVNGNQGIIVYDMRSTNVNLKHAAAWSKIFKKHKVRSGKEAYLKAVEDGKIIKKTDEVKKP
jgi:hypothetical protein